MRAYSEDSNQCTCMHSNHSQAFRFVVGPGHCPMISKYGPSLSKAVDPYFLVVKKSLIKIFYLAASLQTAQNRKYMQVVNTVKHALSSPSKEKNKDLNNKWVLNEGRKYCRMLPLEHSAILLTCIMR